MVAQNPQNALSRNTQEGSHVYFLPWCTSTHKLDFWFRKPVFAIHNVGDYEVKLWSHKVKNHIQTPKWVNVASRFTAFMVPDLAMVQGGAPHFVHVDGLGSAAGPGLSHRYDLSIDKLSSWHYANSIIMEW